jgi:hypothetical protein
VWGLGGKANEGQGRDRSRRGRPKATLRFVAEFFGNRDGGSSKSCALLRTLT